MGNEIKIVARKKFALAENRTWASRVAGENSTTEPPVLAHLITLTSYKRTPGLLFGELLLFVIYNAFVELAKQSRSLLITESFHFSWITEVFATL